ncbi:dihydroxyacetone kinase subunit DhaL [Salibacterium halotolerans]|uniref:phosphoenolpyruvate--glycerone phosphotransferase n=1 Tax=Salibacterium halotolerans TaxID=1884432 RepID=A0A1I5V6N2_9BACI|nr:dihydroxyacetone kinase subunit DhaL [Salibacterium halotolerans]SFQ03148.1 dihydroxyacetone kinase, C-terminal domain [Salibacterium halotolerans]
MELTTNVMKYWLVTADEKMQTHKEYLSELDQAIGDGDHGHNMARGFQVAAENAKESTEEDIGALMKAAAMTLISKVGGASGPLYGTAFLKASDKWKGKTSLSKDEFAEGLEAAVEGIKTRGKAEAGSKTMLDVWTPVLDYVQHHDIAAPDVSAKAKESMEQTESMKAEKGRASYYGEESISHIDPGAYSSYLLFEALAEALDKEEA